MYRTLENFRKFERGQRNSRGLFRIKEKKLLTSGSS